MHHWSSEIPICTSHLGAFFSWTQVSISHSGMFQNFAFEMDTSGDLDADNLGDRHGDAAGTVVPHSVSVALHGSII